jgi:YCII-related domain-containing protein
VRAFEDGMPNPDVPETAAEGKRRYLMLVCADMRPAMAEESAQEAEALSPDLWDPPDPEPAPADEDAMGIDAWCDSVADRRIYGWPLAFPNTAVTVRRIDGRVVTTDGPFAETKEQVAGYDLLECRDLDEALSAAGTHPVARGGAIEVRPVLD